MINLLPLDMYKYTYDCLFRTEQDDNQNQVFNILLINKVSYHAVMCLFRGYWNDLDNDLGKEREMNCFIQPYELIESIEPHSNREQEDSLYNNNPLLLFRLLKKKLYHVSELYQIDKQVLSKTLFITYDNIKNTLNEIKLKEDQALIKIWPKLNEMLPIEVKLDDPKDAEQLQTHIASFEGPLIASLEKHLLVKFDDQYDLDLTRLELDFIPTIIKKLPSLSINLSQNKIKSIIGFNNLKSVKINDNRINTIYLYGLQNLRALDLVKNNFSFIPELIFELTGLKTLSFSLNKLQYIQDQITKLTNLEKIAFSDNKIVTINPITRLNNLKIVYLGNNQIEDITLIPMFLTKLEILSLYNNKIRTIPNGISNLIQLKTLNLSQNPIPISNIPDSIVKLPQLKSFYQPDGKDAFKPEQK